MANTIPLLLVLQEIDLALDVRRTDMESARARLGESEELLAARERLATAGPARTEQAKRQREQEAEVADSRAKVEPLEKRLYDGSIRNPKELQALDHEVTTMKQALAGHEATLLEQMTVFEGATIELEDARRVLAETEQRWAAEQKRLSAEIARLEGEIAGLEARRKEAVKPIDAPSMQVYVQLRPRTGGRVVARVERGMCGGCRISLPINIVSRARSGVSIVQCTSCHRILMPA